jgi:hypothetical protein
VATVIPELSTPLGDVPRGARRHDLVLLGVARGRRTLVGVEAKADEPFDAPVAQRVQETRRKEAEAVAASQVFRSAQIPRIERLARALLGREALAPNGSMEPDVGRIPFQLLAGLAGTLIEAAARGAEQAAFVVHAFHSQGLDLLRVAANDDGFKHFLAGLDPGEHNGLRYGELHGPLEVPGGEGIPRMPVYVGMTATTLTDA